MRPYMRETLNLESEITDVKSTQEIYSHLALDLLRCRDGDNVMILGYDVYHAIRSLE